MRFLSRRQIENFQGMPPSQTKCTVRHAAIAAVTICTVLTLCVAAHLDRNFFHDESLSFRLNAASAVVVPSAILMEFLALAVWAMTACGRINVTRLKVRHLMMAIALLSFGLGTARWWVRYHFETIYSPGYSESRFQQLRIGMTPVEVESILGRPIRTDATSPRWSPFENWVYSEPPPPGTIGENYWRRWVLFDRGKVVAIVAAYYED